MQYRHARGGYLICCIKYWFRGFSTESERLPPFISLLQEPWISSDAV